MKRLYLIILLLVVGLATYSFAGDKSFKAILSGSESVPAVETMAKGSDSGCEVQRAAQCVAP